MAFRLAFIDRMRRSKKTRLLQIAAGLAGLGLALLALRSSSSVASVRPDEVPQSEGIASVIERGNLEDGALVAAAVPGAQREVVVAPLERDAAGGEARAGSIAEGLLSSLRAIASQAGFHGRAWEILEAPSAALLALGPEALMPELDILERAGLDRGESVLVRGACRIALGRAAPPGWCETRFPLDSGEPPEVERSTWLALALRRDTAHGQAIDLARFESPSKGTAYPAVVDRRADAGALALARRRLREPLPPDAYGDLGWKSPAVKDEVFTRELLVLIVFGPGALEGDEETATLFAWLDPRSVEEAFLERAAAHALGIAAAASDAIAADLLDVALRASGPRRLRLLECLVRQGGRESAVVGPLSTVFLEGRDGEPSVEADRIVATDLLDDLLRSSDPSVREAAASLAQTLFADPTRDSMLRYGLLSSLVASGAPPPADVLLAALDGAQDTDLLFLLADGAREIGGSDPDLALRLLVRILGKGGLSEGQRIAIVSRIAALPGPAAGDALWDLSDHDPSPRVRDRARAAWEARDR